jgi:23S rRNA (uracil1939-C5)-methyltransferase
MDVERVECPHADRCPGCPLIDASPAEQLEAKARRLARALAPFGSRLGRPEPVRPAPSAAEYRTRAKLVVAPRPPRLGLFAGAHEVVDVPGCRVLAPPLSAAAAGLRGLLADPPREAAGVLRAEGDGEGRLRAVDLREVCEGDESGVLVTLVLRDGDTASEAELAAACRALVRAVPSLRGVALSRHRGKSPQLLGDTPRVLLGPAQHRDRLRPDRPWALVSHGSFAQAHREQAAAIQHEVERALAPLAGLRVLELYAGSGSLGLALAAAGARVTAVEAFAPAARAAAEAARAQGLDRLDARAGSAEQWLPRLAAAGERYGAVIANPPRRGLAPRVREAIARLGAERVVYVSCEPTTLARDLAHLATLGLRAERLVPFDLLPQTAEVECLAVLRRAAPPAPSLLFEDERLCAIDRPAFGSSPPGDATPLREPEPGASGVSLFARDPETAAALEKARIAVRWLALVRGTARARGWLGERGGGLQHRRLAVLAGHALLEVRSQEAQPRSIRRQLAAIGEPVLGDERHGHAPSNRHLFERYGLDRPFLHCASVELAHPETGAALRIESPLAPDLALVLERLGGELGAIAGAGA